MKPGFGPRVGWALWALNALLWALSLVFWGLGGWAPLPGVDPTSGAGGPVARLLFVVVFVAIATLGALILARQSDNPIGWICGMAPILQVVPTLETDIALYLVRSGVGGPEASLLVVTLGWLGSWSALAGTALIGPVLLLLPNGHLPSPRWRPVLWLAVSSVALAAVTFAFMPGPLRAVPSVDNPLGIAGGGALLQQLRLAASVLLPLGILLSASALVVRLRRARGEERQQLKWIAYGAVIWAVAYAATVPRVWAAAAQIVYLLALGGFVAALGLAVLKYRLYDVDVVINRTLVYSGLAVCITGVYVAVVAGLGAILGSQGEPSLALSLVATALVAAAFQPVRDRLQRVANRLVYGQRASPYEVLADVSRRISGALSVDAVLPHMAEAAARGVGATRSRVRVYVPGGRDRAVAWPAEAVGLPFERTVPVLHQGALVGEIAVAKAPGDPLTPTEAALLADLAAQAGPALSNVRLALDLRTQAEELRASRQRIVAAQDAERRRLERDIHDGAQQQLVAMAVNLQVAEELISTEPQEAQVLVAEVRAQAGEALGTLRDLARGIYPPTLADHGIAAALEAHLAKTRAAVSLEADPRAARQRYPSEVEAAVYFCVLEALQNCAKHAPQAAVRVRLDAEPDRLRFVVSDDGPGFEPASPRLGIGLQGMADRVAALGGSLDICSAPGQGTTIAGLLPIGQGRPAAHEALASSSSTSSR